jgi:hypothetical protein
MSVALPREEHETKYVFPNSRAAILRRFLSMKCIPDGDYAEGLISSIYFDTSHLELLDEKLNSDFLKVKVRLRWYSSVTSGLPYPPVFLEVKRKIGSARRKARQQVDCFGDCSTLIWPSFWCSGSRSGTTDPTYRIVERDYA